MNLAKANLLDVLYVARNMREWDRREIFATRWNDDPDALTVEIVSRCGPCWWVAGTERAIAVIGATEIWPGVWSAGMFATDEFPKIGLSLTRWVRKSMIPLLRSEGMHRAECRSMAGHEVAHRWLALLGAEMESRVPNYGKGGEDFFTFAWRF